MDPNRKICLDIYRKPTHTDHYLNFDSHHPVHQKLGIVRTLFYRCNNIITEPTKKDIEKDKIKQALRICKYPEWALRDGTTSGQKTQDKKQYNPKEPQQPRQLVVLPYVAGLSEKLCRVYKKHNVTLCSKPGRTLRQALVSPKDPVEPLDKCGVVYNIKCETCQESYIGETGRTLSTRV